MSISYSSVSAFQYVVLKAKSEELGPIDTALNRAFIIESPHSTAWYEHWPENKIRV
jgi:hypothetical protein